MDITEEQRQRAERSRLAALAKRKASTSAKDNNNNNNNTWALFKCRKVSPGPEKPITNPFPQPQHPFPFKFRIRLEICSPDSFSITPAPLPSFPYPGEKECFNYLSSWLSSVMPSRYTQNHSGGKASVYKLIDYHIVLQCLKKLKGNEIQEIPWRTLAVAQKLSHSFVADRWMPCMPEHLSDDDVDALLKTLPKVLLDALLPFQLDGVRYALRRGGRCLLADEMGLGKTIQAIAIACCFMNEGPILVVCPAILRYSWAEELERWLPICSPTDIHLVFGHQDNPIHLRRCPKVVVISYTMLQHLQKSISEQQWALLVFDESHHVRCSKKRTESDEVKAVLEVAAKVKRKILLSGTPSLSRPYDIFHQINMLWPGLLGTEKFEFAKTYCETKFLQGSQGKIFQDFSKGIRLEELNVLLTQTIMIRRLKEHVLVQLPPKRRQIIRLVLTRSDIVAAIMASDTSVMGSKQETPSAMKPCTSEIDDGNDGSLDALNDCDDNSTCHRSSRKLSYQELGIAKLSGFREWLSLHPIVAESECEGDVDMDLVCQKMVIFAHHLKVLDGIQAFICEKGIGFVRIDGNTLARDRQSAVQAFRSSAEIKIAIIGITAGGVGIDFSSAQNVVFLELPQSVSEMLQAEDRAHRRGQTNAVNIYIFCAKDTSDERRWPNLNKSLHRVSSVMNGKHDAVREIAVDRVSDLALEGQHSGDGNSGTGHSGASPISKIDCGISSNVLHEPYEAETSNSENGSVILGLQPVKNNEEVPLDNLVKEKDSNACDITMTENSVLNGKGYTSEAAKIECPAKIDGNKLDEDDNEMLRILLPQAKSLKSESDEALCVGDESRPIEVIRDDACLIASGSLRFEVSKYTGRVHLYTCIPGKDLRPKPLFENFHPEELDLLNYSSVNKSKKTGEYVVKENPAYLDNLLEFVKEWNNLRPIEKSKLHGKPLQLPLSFELYYLKESMNHGSKGLLNGGSKRRSTPLNEISYPLPENAEWKVVSLCSGYGKKEKQYTQGWTVTGEPLCKLCQSPCKGKLAKTPEFFEDLFCNMTCFKEYRTRTSQRCLREELFKIEHGVCRLCNLDCHKLIQGIRPLSVSNRQKYIERVAPKLASQKKQVNKLVNEPVEGNAWHADHIIAVHKGGGECSLDNMRTLCVACHKEVTAAQRTDQRLARKAAKDQLQLILHNLKNVDKAEKASSKLKNQSKLEMETNQTDEELLFTVPGSAYTIGKSMVIESEQSCSNEEDLLFKVAGSSYSEGKNIPFQEEKESSSNGDGLLFKLPCSVHTEGTSTVVECEQKSSSKENELLCEVPSSAITECKSIDIETKEKSFSNQDYFSKFTEGKSTTIEIKEKVFPNEDDLHLEVPSTVGSEAKSTVIHSE